MKRFENVTGSTKRLAALLLVAVAAGCGGGGGGGGRKPPGPWSPPAVNLAPTVSGTLNANGATNVAINTKVGATFSEPMDPASITATTFFLMQGATLVPATVSYTGVSAVLVPSAHLAPNARYTVTIKGGAGGASDVSGNDPGRRLRPGPGRPRAGPDITAPTISGAINLNGATNVALNTKVGATFSEAMDPATITSATFFLTQGTTLVPAHRDLLRRERRPGPVSQPRSAHPLRRQRQGWRRGVRDLAGNALARDYELAWTTGDANDATRRRSAGPSMPMARRTSPSIPRSARRSARRWTR